MYPHLLDPYCDGLGKKKKGEGKGKERKDGREEGRKKERKGRKRKGRKEEGKGKARGREDSFRGKWEEAKPEPHRSLNQGEGNTVLRIFAG